MSQGVYVVIGAGPGIGMATAERFAREGFDVALISRSAQKLIPLQTSLESHGRTVRTFIADAGDPVALRSALEAVEAAMGTVTVLHYNAVGFHIGGAEALTPEALEQDLRVGVVGALVAAQAVLPGFRARGGTLLFTGGGAAFGPSTSVVTLSVQKAALRNLALSFAETLNGSPVRVGTVTVSTGVQPGEVAERIAGLFWDLHTGAAGGPEVVFPAR